MYIPPLQWFIISEYLVLPEKNVPVNPLSFN